MSTPRSSRRAGTAAAVTVAAATLAASGLALAPAASAGPVPAAQAAPGSVSIQLLGMNDFHGHLDPGRASSDPSVAGTLGGAVKQQRGQVPDSLFVSAGDNIGASPFISSSQKDEPTLDVLNAMGLDISSVGNHEFDRGYDDLVNRVIPRAKFPYLGANVQGRDPMLAPTNVITTKSGIRVGFIGVVTEETASLVSPSGIQGVRFDDPAVAINKAADRLSDGDASNEEADVVVVLSHEGAPVEATTPEQCAAMAARGDAFGNIVSKSDANVDAILGGHTHLAINCELPKPGGGMRPVTEAISYGTAMSKTLLSYDPAAKAVTGTSAELLPLKPGAYPTDPAIESIVTDAKAKADQVGREVIGSITTDIPRAKTASGAEDRGSESLLGNFIADVQLQAAAGAAGSGEPMPQIAFMNPGGLRADLLVDNSKDGEQPGQISYAEAAVTQPFANTLFTLTLTGAEVKQVLEQQYQPAGSSRPFLALGVSKGFRYELDGSKPSGARIGNITLNGTPIDPTKTYRVVTNSFLASGGDNFTTLGKGAARKDTGLDDLSVLVAYFRANSPVTPDASDRSVLIAPLATASPSPSASATATATASPSPSPTVSSTPSPTTTPTLDDSACIVPARVSFDRATIIATGSAQATVTAQANSIIDLFAYSQPFQTFRIVRSAEVGADGTAVFRLAPPTNTRVYAQQRGCTTDAAAASKVLNVRTALSIAAKRNGSREYTFTGESLPARTGGLIVSLYRVTPKGQQVLTSQVRANASNGEWTIRRTFLGNGRFGFVARTGQDLQNAPGASNTRPVLIY